MSLQQLDPRQDAGANAAIQSLVNEDVQAPEVYSNQVDLPGGWVDRAGLLHKQAEVRELTGADEEVLARVLAKGGDGVFNNWINKVVVLGTVAIGPYPFTEDILNELLVGDRDALFLGIRTVTYGNEYEATIHCPVCDRTSDVAFEMNTDVKYKTIDDGEEIYRSVPIRHGRSVDIRLVRVADQALAASDASRTVKEWNTILFARIVRSITEANGNHHGILGEDTMRQMGSADRLKLAEYLRDNSPGPLLGEVVAECPKCNQESPIALDMAAMFP